MRLLGTIRLSHLTDETASPETQRNSITQYASFRSAELIGIAEDLDVSGAVSPFERAELGPWLTEPGKISQWDAIVIHKLDRLSRSLLDFASLLEWCQERGKTIVSVSESLDFSTPSGQFVGKILILFAEFERATMKERRSERAVTDRQGGYISYGPAFIPYGYRRQKSGNHWELVPDPGQKEIVNWIADQCIAGKSATRIAKALIDRGTPSARGGRWTSTIILNMMRNPVIRGYVVAQPKSGTRNSRQIVRDTEGMPVRRAPLISDGKWARLQVALEHSSRPHSGLRHGASLLLRVAFCGRCGEPLYINRRIRDGKPLGTYYRHTSPVSCREPQMRADLLEPAIEGILLDELGEVPMQVKKVIPVEDTTRLIAELEEAIAALEAQSVDEPSKAATYVRMIGKLEDRRDKLAAEPARQESEEWGPVLPRQTFAQHWESLDRQGKHAFLRSSKVRVFVQHLDPDEPVGMPLPDKRGTVIRLVGNGLQLTIYLGDLAELRDRASQSDA